MFRKKLNKSKYSTLFQDFKYRFKTYKFFRSLFTTYIIVFTLIALISFSLFIVAQGIVKRQFNSLSSALLSTFSQNASNNTESLNNLYLSTPKFFDIYSMGNLDITQTMQLQNFFNNSVSSNYMINIAMYSIDDNKFITENNVVLNTYSYFCSFYNNYGKSYDEWLKEISIIDTNPHYYFDSSNIVRYQRTYINNSGKQYNVIFLVNKNIFFNYIAKNKNIVIFYNNKCYGANGEISKIGQYYLDNNSEYRIRYNHRKYNVYKQESQNSNLTYALIQTADSSAQSSVWFYVTFGINILFYILIGIFLSFIMTSRHFKPIENIISILPTSEQRKSEKIFGNFQSTFPLLFGRTKSCICYLNIIFRIFIP